MAFKALSSAITGRRSHRSRSVPLSGVEHQILSPHSRRSNWILNNLIKRWMLSAVEVPPEGQRRDIAGVVCCQDWMIAELAWWRRQYRWHTEGQKYRQCAFDIEEWKCYQGHGRHLGKCPERFSKEGVHVSWRSGLLTFGVCVRLLSCRCRPCWRVWRLALSPCPVRWSCRLALSFWVLSARRGFSIVSEEGDVPRTDL